MTFCRACYTIKRCKGRLRRQANTRRLRRFYTTLCPFADRVTSRHALGCGASRACVFGQTKNTARTRQAVQFVGRGDARRKERQSRDGTAIVRRRRDRVTRNTRRQPRLRVRANKKTRPVQDKPCNLLAGETRFEHATYGFGDRYSTVEPLP